MAEQINETYWRNAFGKDEVIQRIRPEHTAEFLNNPHKGTTTFQRFNGDALYPDMGWSDANGPMEFPPPANADLHNDRYPPTRMAYCRWKWSDLQPEKDRIRFDLIEQALATAASRGQTLSIRAQPWAGGRPLPEWYWQTGAGKDPQFKSPIPDHNHPRYMEYWGGLIHALGERFDGHPALESVDIAVGGPCGETGGNATVEKTREITQIYIDAFGRTQLVTLLGGDSTQYAMRYCPTAGWRVDSYGDVHTGGLGMMPDHLCWNHMRDAYPRSLFEAGAQDAWKNGPVTLETSWTVAYWHQEGFDLDEIIEQGYKYHPTVFMPKSVFVPHEWMDKIMAFNQRLGYWLHLHQMVLPLEAKGGDWIKAQVTIDNKGVAPLYRPYRMALRFSQGGEHHIVPLRFDVRKLLPDLTYFGERFMFPRSLHKGEAKVSMGIIDEQDRPVVRLAIKAVDAAGWHPLTSMDVV